ncbi:hypothetical protein DFR44_1563 [Hydromonas duriensis]|uniref:Uncharacterized protein n=1 Tax=Hydromonas duriensis TaxID=1527608 RepID=A0A4R6Y099_9BURK|nr:hypothetical protein DFR44_1563 [Hydromonas duriensis]
MNDLITDTHNMSTIHMKFAKPFKCRPCIKMHLRIYQEFLTAPYMLHNQLNLRHNE